MVRVSVVIPALNEADVIGDVVRELPWGAGEGTWEIAECLVVDNGSTDGTGEAARAAGAKVVGSPRGYGHACWAGSVAADEGSTVLVYCDGDGADATGEMGRLVGPIARGEADFVIGSRIRGRREPGSMLGSQVFAAWLVGVLLRGMPGVSGRVRYTDMGAFRAIRRESFERLGMREMTYGWNLEMQIRAAQARMRVLEVPVDYRCRRGGVSKVSGDVRASIRAGVRILEVLFRVGMGRGGAR